ncbi:hypothetical protein BX666DRAFT_1862075 [Dichotomocladium elegans]|nr:hypothetical protein BX666DRAFT_1862075 [Dichotomocladium elegans]
MLGNYQSIIPFPGIISFGALHHCLGGSQQAPGQQTNQRRTPQRRAQHRPTPQMVEMVRNVFPNIPVPAIVADLQRTGSVERTIDNALRDGGLPMPPPPPAPSPPPMSHNASSNGASSSSSIQKGSPYSDLVQRYRITTTDEETQLTEPEKIWEASPEKRQEVLRKRKEFMVLQARKYVLLTLEYESISILNETLF